MKHVLFVCVENSCRSQMAEAFANMYGQEVIKAYSCGSRPSGKINPRAVTAMREAGYDLSVHASKGPDAVPDITYDLLVTLGCGDACPVIAAQAREDWPVPDPREMDQAAFASVRDTIADRVRQLIAGLSRETG